VTIYDITTNFGIRIRLYPAFQCTKFQGNWIMHLCFITTFTPWRKKKGKNEETKPVFEGSYLGNALNWNLKCEVMSLAGISTAKIVWFVKVSQSYVYVKIALLFFLLITHWYGALASCTTRHTTVCLDLNLSPALGSAVKYLR